MPIRQAFREPVNAVTHLFGALGCIVMSVVLVIQSHGDLSLTIAYIVFGLSALMLYGASTAYHTYPTTSTILQRLDHSAIYFMIAGTHTPICFLGLEGRYRYGVLIAQWSLALIGLVANLKWGKAPMAIRLPIYLLMGWMSVPLIPTMLRMVTMTSIWWLLAGGLVYTVGTIIYASKRPRLWPDRFSSHELWHLFVLGGTACHIVTMFLMSKA